MGEIGGYYIPGVNLLSELTTPKPQNPLSTKKMLEGLMVLNDLMKANGIDYVLTGSLGLYLHGLVPESYIPHDIDIIISSGENKHLSLTSQMILDLFSQHSGGYRPEYEYIDASNLFVFYVGLDKVEINAFVDVNSIFSKSDFCVMNIMGYEIRVNNAFSIFKEKYKMRRLKDFIFHNQFQTSLNSLFISEQTNCFDDYYDDIIMLDKIRDFFNGINWMLGKTEIKIFAILFNEEVAKIWLPQRVWKKCIIKAASWDNNSETDSIIFGIEGEFTNISKLDEWKVFQGCLKHDMSYMVDFLFHILSTMKIVDYFAAHVSELICAINEHEKPLDDPDDLPF
jgi:hypothetical protein